MNPRNFPECAFALVVLGALTAVPGSEPAEAPATDGSGVAPAVTFEPTLITGSGLDMKVLIGTEVLNGDWDGNGRRDLTDVYLCAQHLFNGGAPAVPVLCLPTFHGPSAGDPGESTPTLQNGDIDGSGQINVTDLFRLARYLYRGDAEEPAAIGCDPRDAT